jgi:hypothetical protein
MSSLSFPPTTPHKPPYPTPCDRGGDADGGDHYRLPGGRATSLPPPTTTARTLKMATDKLSTDSGSGYPYPQAM